MPVELVPDRLVAEIIRLLGVQAEIVRRTVPVTMAMLALSIALMRRR